MKAKNGWQLRNQGLLPRWQKDIPATPTRWDRCLYRHSLKESEVVPAIQSGKAGELAKWVRGNYLHCFIPEKVVEALGLESEAWWMS